MLYDRAACSRIRATFAGLRTGAGSVFCRSYGSTCSVSPESKSTVAFWALPTTPTSRRSRTLDFRAECERPALVFGRHLAVARRGLHSIEEVNALARLHRRRAFRLELFCFRPGDIVDAFKVRRLAVAHLLHLLDDARHLFVGEDRRFAKGQRLDIEAGERFHLDRQPEAGCRVLPSEIWPCWPSRQAAGLQRFDSGVRQRLRAEGGVLAQRIVVPPAMPVI